MKGKELPPLTAHQRSALFHAVIAADKERWIRSRTAGERVTLASLFRRGLIVRRAWRGVDGEHDASYEYQASAEVLTEWRRRGATSRRAA